MGIQLGMICLLVCLFACLLACLLEAALHLHIAFPPKEDLGRGLLVGIGWMVGFTGYDQGFSTRHIGLESD